ncbi:hypothetical protein [Vibrio quintilis]|uniref:Short chain dehydrogenase n=1 Tax=Vibrio quintilis TaxID=1117707 RepID=A0A1M7YYA1_9VIBR|nr:hypothetical protein [Vibrio quintilis]SHO57657.1 hypothetical protein VQ7734_03427 [Vibrio quintilis]
MSQKVVMVTGSSSGFGCLISEARARAGHTVTAAFGWPVWAMFIGWFPSWLKNRYPHHD